MIKKLALSIALATVTLLLGCSTAPTPKPDPIQYTAYGRYYVDGTVITNDGNEWAYDTDTISDKVPYDGMPVWIAFNDNGTPADITDDPILGLVYDRMTAAYDELEEKLGESYDVTRKGNNIKINNTK